MDTNMVKKKTTQGRRKIEIKKIEENNSRQVTFSKRRGGLFKKASELCVLTGAEIALMVHSPGGRVFAFGHPSPDHVMNRYLSTSGYLGSKQTTKLADPKPFTSDFNQHYAEISKELEEEKKKKDVIDQSNEMVNNGMFWWDEPIDGLTLEELEQYVASLEELKNKVVTRVEELTMIRSSSLSSVSSKSLLDVNQTPKNDFGEFGDYQNMEYGGSTNSLVPLGLDFGSGET